MKTVLVTLCVKDTEKVDWVKGLSSYLKRSFYKCKTVWRNTGGKRGQENINRKRGVMGNIFSSIFDKLWGINKELRILILGLDGAGKTTILYRLQIGEVVTTKPTIGFNVETLTYKNLKLNVWDLGGQTSIRPYWRCYYANTAAVIFVVDSTDKDRMSTASKELHMMLQEEELQDAALLVFANKQDQPGALSASEVSKELSLVELKDRSWSIVASSAIKGEGINEGLDWLTEVIKEEQL